MNALWGTDGSGIFRLYLSEAEWAGPRPQKGNKRRTILLLDSDLGFTFWLGHALDAAGYSAIPAKDVRAASGLICEHRLSIDTLVIDPFLADVFPFVAWLRQSQPGLNVVAAFPDDWGVLPAMSEVTAVIRKPHHLSVVASIQWVNLIQNLTCSHTEMPQTAPKSVKS